MTLGKMVSLCAVLFAAAAASGPTFASQSMYDVTVRCVRGLSESPHVRLLPFGKSAAGRLIPAYIISDFSKSREDLPRTLIIAGQHGDEPSSVRSVLRLSRELAEGNKPDLLTRSVIIVVPMVNPDGAAHDRRYNAWGMDINRDWSALATPEARYVHQLIKKWRPQILIDAHEWTGPLPGHPNAVENLNVANEDAVRGVTASVAGDSGLSVVQDAAGSDGRLFHRRYAALGYAAYLLETSPGRPFPSKHRAYRSAILAAVGSLVEHPELGVRLSPASGTFQPAMVSAYLEPIPKISPDHAATTAVCVLLGIYCFLMWALKPSGKTGETPWSRRFRKCLIDAGLQTDPLRSRHQPQPITARSWARRRLRARYAPR